MQKALILFFIISNFIAPKPLLAASEDTHLEKLKTKYPYGLLTDDYNILSENDLAANTCNVTVEPVSNKSYAYSYWQCFDVKDAKFECEDAGFDESEKKETALLAVSVHSKSEINEYLSPRAIPTKDCQSIKRDWGKHIAEESYVCLSGTVINYKEVDKGDVKNSWTFDKFKTQRGCSSYFLGECDLSIEIKNGCNIK